MRLWREDAGACSRQDENHAAASRARRTARKRRTMKKLAFTGAAAVLASGAALAQSSVTLYGVVDVAAAYYKGEGAGSRAQLISGGNQQSRIGFRGKEDLGDGLYAGFELEAGIAADSGNGQASNLNNQASGVTPGSGLTFNRKSFVSLGGNWGEIRLGRDYVPTFWILFAYDPFRTGVGFGGATTQGGSPITQLRASNSIQYLTRTCFTYECTGFYGQVMYAMGENLSDAPNSSDGQVAGLRVGYGGGNWDIAVGHTETKAAAVGRFRQTVIGGSWNFGGGRLLLQAGEHSTTLPVAALQGGTKAPFWQVGAFINAGPGYIPIAFTRVKRNDGLDSSADKFAVGYVYQLSKRSALYTTYARINNKGAMQLPVNTGVDAGPVPVRGGYATGVDVGIRHSF
jgi:predicted porin